MSTEYTVPDGFREVEGPQQFKFEKTGDVLESVTFRSWRNIELREDGKLKKVVEFTFVTPNGTRYRVLPPWDLREKLGPDYVGKRVIIRLMGTDESKGRNGNPMKIFGVWAEGKISQNVAPNLAGEYITDDDIPF